MQLLYSNTIKYNVVLDFIFLFLHLIGLFLEFSCFSLRLCFVCPVPCNHPHHFFIIKHSPTLVCMLNSFVLLKTELSHISHSYIKYSVSLIYCYSSYADAFKMQLMLDKSFSWGLKIVCDINIILFTLQSIT